MAVTSCRHFLGYKPCGRSSLCDDNCSSKDIPTVRILLIHLGALGAVVRATALLVPIRRKYPGAHITWVTDHPGQNLLLGHPLIDRVLTTQVSDLLILKALHFDIAYVVDKSLKAAGVLATTTADQVFGFVADPNTGSILPATPAAEELWQAGLDNHFKFYVNKKTELQMLVEALELSPWTRDRYNLPLMGDELPRAQQRFLDWSSEGKKIVVGLNTGCAPTIPWKRPDEEHWRNLIRELLQWKDYQIVLLGGPEDAERNAQLSRDFAVINSPCHQGLRDGLVSVSACEIVLSGDSLGMHMAISQGCWTIAWFGPTCAHEIEFFDRGEALKSELPCAPCWRRNCERVPKCNSVIPIRPWLEALDRAKLALKREPHWLRRSLFKQHFLETSSSLSRC